MPNPREVVCPDCGARIPLDDPGRETGLVSEGSEASRTVETILPRTTELERRSWNGHRSPGLGTGPNGPPVDDDAPDGSHVFLTDQPLDPELLEAIGFQAPLSPDPDAAEVVTTGPALESLSSQVVVSAPEPAAASDPAPADVVEVGADRPPAASPSPPPAGAPEPPTHDDPPARAWGRLLLGSYASAVTLACLWLLWQSRHPGPSTGDSVANPRQDVTAAQSPDTGLRGASSQRLTAPVRLPADRIIRLGQRLVVGDLEIAPLSVELAPVVLERTSLDGQRTEESKGLALRLRVRLSNRSSDAIFAPLDEGFVREPDRGLPASYVEQLNGPGRSYLYPLPVSSEWTIVGQEFRDLRPGESFETILVSSTDLAEDPDSERRWRVKFRTGPGQGETVNVGILAAPNPASE